MTMTDLCDYMLSWITALATDENAVIPITEDIYELAVLIIGVAVPLLLYLAVLVALIFMFGAAFDVARGLHK